MRNRTRLAFAFMVVVVLGATAMSATRRNASPARLTGATPALAATRDQAFNANTSLADGFRAAARRALPGVVHIQVEVEPGRAGGRDPRWPPYDSLRDRQREPRVRVTSGSGFVLRSDGYILTNNHVVERARRITVFTQDRHELPATVVGRDPNTDIAVIRVEANGLVEIPLADSDSVEVGDWVVALGYPLDLGSTATVGIVSAKGRNINILRQDDPTAPSLESFIQTDAAINPGNSGGPLVDLDGRAVGMSSAIQSQTGFFAGYGFAVPINLVRRVADDLIQYGEARRPMLGIYISSVDEADAVIYSLPSVAGAEVGPVSPDSPADRAGIEQGDVIVSVEGRPVETDSELMEVVARYQPGQKIRVGTIRYGTAIDRTIELGQFAPAATADTRLAAAPARDWPDGVMRLGFTAGTPDSATAAAFGAADPSSLVVILSVDQTSPARVVLTPGVVVEQVNRQPVKGVADLERFARGLEPGDAVSLLVRFGTGERYIFNYIVR